MNKFSFSLSRTLGLTGAALAALIAAPTGLQANDHDHDKHESHERKVAHFDHVKEVHVDRHLELHADRHFVDHHIVEHHNIEHFVTTPRLAAHHTEIFHERHIGSVVHGHIHHGYVLTYGNGFHGRGFYYGPPNLAFYTAAPDVEYYTSSEAVPTEYLQTATSEAQSTEAAVQAVLADRGYYTGPVDGDIGTLSTQAIARFQSENSLPVTGTITDELLQSLGLQQA